MISSVSLRHRVCAVHLDVSMRGEGLSLSGPISSVKPAVASGGRRTRGASRLASLAPLIVMSMLCGLAAWECHLQLWAPEQSGLAWLHRHGLLTEVETGYAPGRGIGRMLGIAGASMTVLLLGYSVRKRFARFAGAGRLSRWLDVHIALGLAGPVLVTLHTAGRLGGIISVAYWSMMAVVASGVATSGWWFGSFGSSSTAAVTVSVYSASGSASRPSSSPTTT